MELVLFNEIYFECVISKNITSKDINNVLISKAFLNSGLSDYLTLLLEIGLIGLLLCLFVVYFCVKMNFRDLKLHLDKIAYLNKISILVFLAIVSIFNFGFYQLSFLPLFATILNFRSSHRLNDFATYNYLNIIIAIIIITFLSMNLYKQTNPYALQLTSKLDRVLIQNSYDLRINFLNHLHKEDNFDLITKYYIILNNKSFHTPKLYIIFAEAFAQKKQFNTCHAMLKKAVYIEPHLFMPRYTLLMFYLKFRKLNKAKILRNESLSIPIKVKNEKSIFFKNKIQEISIN